MTKTEGIPFPTKTEIMDKIGRHDREAEKLAETLIEMHGRGEVLWDGEMMVLTPDGPNA
jgi:hypothetical protein